MPEIIAPNSFASAGSFAFVQTYEVVTAVPQGGGGGGGETPAPQVADDLTNAYETIVGGALLLGQTVQGPAQVYAALFTADPGETGDTSAEVSGNGYARAAVSFTNGMGAGEFSNDTECLFPETTGAWGLVTHIGLMTSGMGGSMIMSMPLNASVTVAAGEQLRINPGALTVSFS